MLILYGCHQGLIVHFSDKTECFGFQGLAHPVHQVPGLLLPKRLFQNLLGIITSALGYDLFCHAAVIKILGNIL